MSFSKFILLVLLIFTAAATATAQSFPNPFDKKNEPWQKKQLIEPANLAGMINSQVKGKPFIFNIGVMEDIKGARNMGAASEKTNLERFRKVLAGLPKNATIVVYCGCCPFNRCPNIRPAFSLLTQSGYVNARLLNLPTNIKVDWIDKGYPLAVKPK
jgi:hypothetical protein